MMIDELRQLVERWRSEADFVNDDPACRRTYIEAADELESVLARYDGWVMVPVEPDQSMQIAGFESEALTALCDAVNEAQRWPYSCRQAAELVTAVYRAMLAARPTSDFCNQPNQCWEPCGDLGKSEEHARVAPSDSGWQPIETAPKDGTPIIGWGGEVVSEMIYLTEPTDDDDYTGWCYAAFITGGVLYELPNKMEPPPTHWMPLPTPPGDR